MRINNNILKNTEEQGGLQSRHRVNKEPDTTPPWPRVYHTKSISKTKTLMLNDPHRVRTYITKYINSRPLYGPGRSLASLPLDLIDRSLCRKRLNLSPPEGEEEG